MTLASVILLAGCTWINVWELASDPNTYSYELHEDGSMTTYIKITKDEQ